MPEMPVSITKPAGGWLGFILSVALAIFLLNVIMDAINAFTGFNCGQYWQHGFLKFYPGKAVTAGGSPVSGGNSNANSNGN